MHQGRDGHQDIHGKALCLDDGRRHCCLGSPVFRESRDIRTMGGLWNRDISVHSLHSDRGPSKSLTLPSFLNMTRTPPGQSGDSGPWSFPHVTVTSGAV